MTSSAELIITNDTDSRVYTLTLKDENGADRNITGQDVFVAIYNHFTKSLVFSGTGTPVTSNPAVVNITPDDDEIPAPGFYDCKIYIQEDDGSTTPVITYREPYKEFNCYVGIGPVLA